MRILINIVEWIEYMSSSQGRILYIYQDQNQYEEHNKHSLRIDMMNASVSESRVNKQFSTMLNFDIPPVSDVPVYQILTTQVWWNVKGIFGEGSYTMTMLFSFYEYTSEYIERHNIDKIVCRGLRGEYVPVARDLSDSHGISVRFESYIGNSGGWSQNDPRTSHILSDAISAVIMSLLIFADQLVSILLKPLFTRASAPLAVLFPAGRPKTFTPIYNKLRIDSDTVTPLKTVSFLFRHHDVFPGSRFDVRPINTFATPWTPAREIRFLLELSVDIWIRGNTADAIVDMIEDNFGYHVPRTVSYLYRRATLANIESLLLYTVYDDALSELEHKKLFVPNVASQVKALIYAGNNHDINTYQLPHSIMNQYTIYRPYEHSVFVAGDIDERAIAENDNITPINIGYPKHRYVRNRYEAISEDMSAGNQQVLVATQPYPDRIRTRFIKDVLDIVLSKTDFDILIKTHPGEQARFYRRLFEEMNIPDGQQNRISVTDEELYKNIHHSAYVLTIASNVAVEAVIMNTPAVSYNIWAPDIRTPLYVSYGEIPGLMNEDELREFVGSVGIKEEKDRQTQMLRSDYRVLNNDLDTISGRINDTLSEGLSDANSARQAW